MAITETQLDAALAQNIADTQIQHEIVHGNALAVVQTEGGPVRSFAKQIADADIAAASAEQQRQAIFVRSQADQLHQFAIVKSDADDLVAQLGTSYKAAVNLLALVNVRGDWAESTVYAENDVVTHEGIAYIALKSHTAGADFSADLASKLWAIHQGAKAEDLLSPDDGKGASMVGHTDTVEVMKQQVGLGATDLHTFSVHVSRMSEIFAREGNYAEEFYSGSNDWSDAIDAALQAAYNVDIGSRRSFAVRLPPNDITLSRPIVRNLGQGTWSDANKLVPFVILGAGGVEYNGTILRRGWGVNDYPDMGMIHAGPSVANLSANSQAAYGVGWYPAPVGIRGIMLRGGAGTDRHFGHGILVAQTNKAVIEDVSGTGMNGAVVLIDNVFDSTLNRVTFANGNGRVNGDVTDYNVINDRTKLLIAPLHITSSRQGGNSNFVTVNKPHFEGNPVPVHCSVLSRSGPVKIFDPHYEPGYGNLTIATKNVPDPANRVSDQAFFATGRGQAVIGDPTSVGGGSFYGGGEIQIFGGRGPSQGESGTATDSARSGNVRYLLDLGPYGIAKLVDCEGQDIITWSGSVPKSLSMDEHCRVGKITCLGSWGTGSTPTNTLLKLRGTCNGLSLSYCSNVDVAGLYVNGDSNFAVNNLVGTIYQAKLDGLHTSGKMNVESTFACPYGASGLKVGGDASILGGGKWEFDYVGGTLTYLPYGSTQVIMKSATSPIFSSGIQVSAGGQSALVIGRPSSGGSNPATQSQFAPTMAFRTDGTPYGASDCVSLWSANADGTLSARHSQFYRGGGFRVGSTVSDPGAGSLIAENKLQGGFVRTGIYTLTTLPSASAYYGYEIVVSNATGGPAKCWSNGTSWINFATKAAVA